MIDAVLPRWNIVLSLSEATEVTSLEFCFKFVRGYWGDLAGIFFKFLINDRGDLAGILF